MDSTTPLTQKALHARANQHPSASPPPYSSDTSSTTSEGDDDDDPPLKLTLNATHSIRGSNNLIPTSPAPLADATKFAALLLHAVKALNAAASSSAGEGEGVGGGEGGCGGGCGGGGGVRRRPLKLDLTINCGVTVLGNRNVVGAVGLRPKAEVSVPAVLGAKRKGEEEVEDGRPGKKFKGDC